MSTTRYPHLPPRRSRGALGGLLVALSLAAAAACPAPDLEEVEAALGGAAVRAHKDGRLVIEREGEVLLDLDLLGTGVRRADAAYQMEYGMFLIEEYDAEEWQSPSSVRLAKLDGGGLEIALDDDAGPVAFVRVTEGGEGHVSIGVAAADAGQNRARIRMACEEGDHFAGLGAQTHDVDHRGQRVPLWVSEQGVGKLDTNEVPAVWQLVGRRHTTHIPIPAVVTQRSTALVVDTRAYSVFDLCATDEEVVELEVWEGRLPLHVFVGETPVEALARMTDFVGRPELPAPWLHAPWNDAIFGEQSVRDFAAFLRDNEIPSSAIWSEDWRGGMGFGGGLYRLSEDWGLDEELYPDFDDMVADLRADGFAQQVYFNTFVYDDSDVFETITENGWAVMDRDGDPYLFDAANADFSQSALLDLTHPEGVDYVKGHLEAALDRGVLGWMADFAEWMPVARARLHSGEDPALVHNRYAYDWQRINQEVLDEEGADDAIVYARSGHLFSQGVTQVVWAGDQRTSFQADDGLPTIVPIGLGLSAAGYLFYAHDIAGYQSSTNEPASRELFYRWTELGAYSPVMRTHHGTHTTSNWDLQTDEETTAHWKRYASLHIRLYPYVRALAERATAEGVPLWLPLGLVFPDEEEAWPLMDQLMLGDSLLVAPVVTEGATERSVWLPPGRWAPFLDDGEVLTGPGRETVAAPLEEIPVFLRAGGIVPLTANTPQTLLDTQGAVEDLGSVEGDREVWVGLGADGAFTEVSGANYQLEGNGTSLDGLELDEEGAISVTGNGTVEGPGFTFRLSGHPEGRVTRVFLR